jgi:hypothetical protein
MVSSTKEEKMFLTEPVPLAILRARPERCEGITGITGYRIGRE